MSDVERNFERAGQGGSIPSPAGNAFIANRVSLQNLVAWAYGIGESLPSMNSRVARPWATIEGMPSWTERFDIRAKAPVVVPDPPAGAIGPMHLMVQRLLAERFRLTAHWEPRARTTYVLTLGSGGLGPQIRTSTLDCSAQGLAAARAFRLPPGTPPPPLEGLTCHSTTAEHGRDGSGSEVPGTVRVRSGQSSLGALVRALETNLGGQVLDRTGLTGNFDFDLRYTRYRPQDVTRFPSRNVPPLPLAETPVSPDWPVLADALRNQLGIQLTVETVDGEALVIDRVERPTLD